MTGWADERALARQEMSVGQDDEAGYRADGHATDARPDVLPSIPTHGSRAGFAEPPFETIAASVPPVNSAADSSAAGQPNWIYYRSASRSATQGASSANFGAHGPPRAVVLIGSTGAGKSTLGNLLADPRNARSTVRASDMTFKTSSLADPCTTETKFATVVDDPQIRIIDTAGFNDVDVAVDAKNVLKTLESLRHVKNIAAVVYVHSGRTGKQYRDTLKYAGSLFTNKIMSNNLIVVYTGVKQDPDAIEERAGQYDSGYGQMTTQPLSGGMGLLRGLGQQLADGRGGRQPTSLERSGMVVAGMLKKVQAEVKDILGLPVAPPAFDIDSKPPRGSEEEWATTLSRRFSILQAVSELNLVDVSSLRLAKLQEMKRLDGEQSLTLERKARALQKQIRASTPSEVVILRTITSLNGDIADLTIAKRRIQERLQMLDTTDREVAAVGPSKHERVLSDLDLRAVSAYDMIPGRDGYKVEKEYAVDGFTEIRRSAREVVVRMTPGTFWFCRTGGHIVCFCYRRTKYADEILRLEEDLTDVNTTVKRKEGEVEVHKQHSSELRNQYQGGIQRQLDEIAAERARLADTHVDLDTALKGNFVDLLQDHVRKERQA